MKTASDSPAAITQTQTQTQGQRLVLSGRWTADALGAIDAQLKGIKATAAMPLAVDATTLGVMDTAGALTLQKWLQQSKANGAGVTLQGLPPQSARLLAAAAEHLTEQAARPPPTTPPVPNLLARVGLSASAAGEQAFALLSFTGEVAIAFGQSVLQPRRIRWRPILFNIRSAGYDALPIVGLLAFLLGIVVAYQGADQLRQYGANIFVADLVGLSMLREFAPLITAIILAGRSGSAYAAQIGTMAVTEEIDAIRTMGIAPLELLVLPKMVALMVAMPLLTVFADLTGVLGGMLMAKTQLGVSMNEFVDRFVKAVSVTAYLIGVLKAPVFAAIIALVGCFQGFRTRGGADSVGRQTTRSVVQSIFLVIVADGLFSVVFSALDL